MFDVIAIIILAVIATLPLTGYLAVRWGWEQADDHRRDLPGIAIEPNEQR